MGVGQGVCGCDGCMYGCVEGVYGCERCVGMVEGLHVYDMYRSCMNVSLYV